MFGLGQYSPARRLAFCAMLTIVAVGFGLLFIFQFTVDDDWWYMSTLYIKGDDGGVRFSLESIFDTIAYHYGIDNIRLSNTFATFALTLPDWLGRLPNAIVWAVTLPLLVRIAGLTPRNLGRLTIMLVLVTFYPLWIDRMFTLIFAYNYAWGTFTFALVTYFFFRRRVSLYVLIPAGLIAGAWHEGFSLPFICAAIFVMSLKSSYRDRYHVILTLSVAAGLAFLLSCPGLYYRADGLILRPETYTLTSILTRCLYSSLLFVNMILWVVYVCKGGRYRTTALSPIVLFLAAASVASVTLIFVAVFIRCSFCAQIFNCVLFVILLRPISIPMPGRRMRIACLSAVWIFMTAHFAVADATMIRLNRLADRIMSDYISRDLSGSRFVTYYSPVFGNNTLPAMNLMKVGASFFSQMYSSIFASIIYDKPRFYIVPEELRDFEEPVGAAAPWCYKGYYIVPEIEKDDKVKVRADRGLFTRVEEVSAKKFRARNGKTYSLLVPLPMGGDQYLFDWKSVEIIDEEL